MSEDRISRLYPHVQESLLPRAWSSKDRWQFIKLSRGNLRVHYNGQGKNHKDAASVRATHPIPAACGIYYFEVKIISKGKNGYMGIGLADAKVNMNRLPGWENNSYGYHGDDGNSFCSSGNGKKYGPTFTTGDVIGCCVNMIDNSVFYTKNGMNLGTAFQNVPQNLYPTVGLQSPGEIADANFGDRPFMFDIEGYMLEWRTKLREQIDTHVPSRPQDSELDLTLKKLVFSYLIHHGYCGAAESFAKTTSLYFFEDIPSIQNRQAVQRLVMQGLISEAVAQVQQLYPNLLSEKPELLFKLQIRNFIEMIATLGGASQTHPYSIARLMNGKEQDEDKMDVDHKSDDTSESTDQQPNRRALEQLLLFGRDLASQNIQNEELKKQLKDAFSLLAYRDPRQSQMGYLMEPGQREQLCADLNSAMLESHGLPRQPPLELAISQTKNCVVKMLESGMGSGAYTGLEKQVKCSLKPQQ